ncbi:hypothetical protein A9Z42_0027410 [Trichoderma parareesei]|uniref:Uncharacterized protein n=1 Tax=Trichoderma parareesei TaxID=858221 RepID=A0A2H2Z3T5_TRIPA|nr:hypothetical protein A9Z42_0027410 [Trichoderma parareesei]
MSNLPSQHPTLALHLTDLTLTPLITSSSSPAHLESLTSLAASAITAQTAAQRASLGRPQRIMVEYPDSGAVVLQSYLDPRESGGGGLLSESEAGSVSRYKRDHDHDHDHDGHDADVDADDATARTAADDAGPPVLIGVVVAASSDDAREARRAAARLERIGREIQKEWAAQGLDDTDGRSTPE